MFIPDFQNLIASRVAVQDYDRERQPRRNLVLEEWQKVPGSNQQICISSIEITELPENVFAFRVDAFPQPQALLNDMPPGVRKRADFIILGQDENGQKRCVYVEMKRTKDSKQGIISQLKGAVCVFDYCNSVLKNHIGQCAIASDFQPRFVSFGGVALKKARYQRGQPLNDTPDKMLKLTGRSFRYRDLITK